MTVRQRDSLMSHLGELRYEPVDKRVRAELDGRLLVDSTRAVLVWEPRRVVPQYAVPRSDLDVDEFDYLPRDDPGGVATSRDMGFAMPDLSDRPVLDPRVPFAVHTSPGQAVALHSGHRSASGFVLDDPDPALADHVILDFDAFDNWFDEDQRIVAHPRDPFQRIDVLPSSRSVRVEFGGTVIAESNRAAFLFETMLPVRFYFPPEDVVVPLEPTETVTYCAYKGRASYWTADVGDPVGIDLGWSYEDPLHDATRVRGMIAFFTERVDLVLDDEAVARPVTPWTAESDIAPTRP